MNMFDKIFQFAILVAWAGFILWALIDMPDYEMILAIGMLLCRQFRHLCDGIFCPAPWTATAAPLEVRGQATEPSLRTESSWCMSPVSNLHPAESCRGILCTA
jgi:hypothetical protein